jgi:hypothetical protein
LTSTFALTKHLCTEKALRAFWPRGAFAFGILHLTQDIAFAERLSGLADRLRNLTVRHNAPEAFFEQRSELEHELRKLAGEIGRGPSAPTTVERRPLPKIIPGTVVGHKGQFVRVEVRRRRAAA